MNEKMHVIVVFIDFSKAFDCLIYNTLSIKLQDNGVQGPLHEWFKNYHENRYTVVKIADVYSKAVNTKKGTAQGSILGPTEYLLYVNDMCNTMREGSVYQFADDTCLLAAHSDIRVVEQIINNNFNTLCKWAHDVGLFINAYKTKAMHIHTSHNRAMHMPTLRAHSHDCLHSLADTTSTSCNCTEIVNNHTYVGLVIDRRFNL